MTSIVLMLALHSGQVDSILQKNEAVMQAMPTFEVQVTSVHLGRPRLHANMIVDGRKRFYYHALGPNVDYKLSISPFGYRELDQHSRTYDEHPYRGRVQLYPSRISAVGKTIPIWLLAGTLKKLVPSESKFKMMGVEAFAGRQCNHLQANFKTMVGTGKVDAMVGTDGLVYRLEEVAVTPEGTVNDIWELDHYVRKSDFPQTAFSCIVPDGTMPYALTYYGGPSEVGSKPELAGYVDSRSGQPVRLLTGKPLLLLVAGNDSPPSRRAVTQLAGWKSLLASAGASSVAVSTSPTSQGADGLPFNPDQRSIFALEPPATPTFYLFNSKGQLMNLWMGFNPSKVDSLKSEILAAIAAIKG